jgi:superfamily II DNA or RNA helicase
MDIDEVTPQSKFRLCSQAANDALDNEFFLNNNVLFPNQVDALRSLREHFRQSEKNVALAVLPTGTGKSGIIAMAPYILNAARVLVITPSLIITNQIYSDMCDDDVSKTFYVRRGVCKPEDQHKLVEKGERVSKSLGSDMQHITSIFRQTNLVIANAHKFGESSNVDIASLPRDLFDLVIVDEAHHYPAPTWKKIIDHFGNSKRIFLTATPTHKGANIIGDSPEDQRKNYVAYNLTRAEAVKNGIIRRLDFEEVNGDDSNASVILKMIQRLDEHDNQDKTFRHQGMILCDLQNEVDKVYNKITEIAPGTAARYHGASGEQGFTDFKNGLIRILVVCGKATEGFDRPQVSVVGILRNVAAESKVLFNQFVGRAVRRIQGPHDNITAYVISHIIHKQRKNFDNMEVLADVDPQDDA